VKRILIAGLVGGVIVFGWGVVSHMVLPLGKTGLRSLPSEGPVLSALAGSVPEAGLYFFPGFDMEATQTPEQEAAWMERYRSGPAGLLVYRPRGGEPFTLSMLLVELVSNLLAAWVAAFIVSFIGGPYGRRVVVIVLMGLFAWMSLSISYWNWYGFPGDFIVAEGIDQVVGWLLGGLGIALLVPAAGR